GDAQGDEVLEAVEAVGALAAGRGEAGADEAGPRPVVHRRVLQAGQPRRLAGREPLELLHDSTLIEPAPLHYRPGSPPRQTSIPPTSSALPVVARRWLPGTTGGERHAGAARLRRLESP